MKRICLFVLTGLYATGSVSQAQQKPKDGFWRGTFLLAGNQEAPFNMEIKGTTAWVLNGTERFELTGIRQQGDSLVVPVDIYDAALVAKVEPGNVLCGVFRRLNTIPADAGIPFRAEFGKRYRFVEKPDAATVSLHGKWDVTIGNGNRTVGVFSQSGSKVTGTFLTATGDYRYF